MSPETLSTARAKMGLVLLLVLHACVAVFLAVKLNIWVDEASTLYATDNGLLHAIQTAVAEQKQAPLYFWIVSVWRYLSDSILFARLFSVLCSLGAIAAVWSLARRYFSPLGVLLATSFVALHPFLFWASSEIRVYSMVVLLSTLLCGLFLKEFFGERSKVSTILFPVLAVVSLYTNYYLGFLFPGFFAVLVIERKWSELKRFVLMMVIAGIAFLPLALTIATEMRARNAGYHDPRSLIDGVKIVWNHLLTFVLPTEIYTGETPSAMSVVRVWIVRLFLMLTAGLAIFRRSLIRPETRVFAAVVAGIGAMLVAANMLVGPSLVILRHASMLFVPVLLLFGLLIRDLSPERGRNVLIAFAAPLVLIFFGYGILNMYPGMVKRGDWEQAVRFIESHEMNARPLVVFPAFDALVPRYYRPKEKAILPASGFFNFVFEAPDGSPDRFRSELEHIIASFPDDADHIWLSTSDRCDTGENCGPLQKYVEANYTIVLEREFYLQKLYLLKRKGQ